LYAQHIEGNGKLLLQEVIERNVEGIVAKRRIGVYAEHGWLKIKNPTYRQVEGRQEIFQSFRTR
jgi:ATP-dependent DNA ligase